MIELVKAKEQPKMTKSAQIRNYVAKHPKAKSADVAKAIGVTPAYVATVMWTAKKKAKVVKKAKAKAKPKWEQLGLFSSNKSIGQLAYEAGVAKAKLRMEGDRQIEMFEPKPDAVNPPCSLQSRGNRDDRFHRS
jgi:hypothetical protein